MNLTSVKKILNIVLMIFCVAHAPAQSYSHVVTGMVKDELTDKTYNNVKAYRKHYIYSDRNKKTCALSAQNTRFDKYIAYNKGRNADNDRNNSLFLCTEEIFEIFHFILPPQTFSTRFLPNRPVGRKSRTTIRIPKTIASARSVLI